MIAITADEKNIIIKKYPHVHIVRTMRQDSKRHHYYMTEDWKPMMLLNSIRNQGSTPQKKFTNRKDRAGYQHSKKSRRN